MLVISCLCVLQSTMKRLIALWLNEVLVHACLNISQGAQCSFTCHHTSKKYKEYSVVELQLPTAGYIIHPSIRYLYCLSCVGLQEVWSLSKGTLGTRPGTTWMVCKPIAGHRHIFGHFWGKCQSATCLWTVRGNQRTWRKPMKHGKNMPSPNTNLKSGGVLPTKPS